MAELDQRTLSASLRLDFNINPNLTVQYYGQPFISRGRYKNLNRVTNPVAGNFRDRVATFMPSQISFNAVTDTYFVDENTDGTPDYNVSNPDFSFVQFRSNLVVRWEYIPVLRFFGLVARDGGRCQRTPRLVFGAR
jgi:hypothetical protein